MPVWEAVTAISAPRAVVIAATVLVGYRQLNHLRLATRLDGTLKILEELGADKMRDAYRFVLSDLPYRMNDQRFRAEIATVGMADENVHQELRVLRLFENVGTYVRFKMIVWDILCDYSGPWIRNTWNTLNALGIIAEHRKNLGGRARRHTTTLRRC